MRIAIWGLVVAVALMALVACGDDDAPAHDAGASGNAGSGSAGTGGDDDAGSAGSVGTAGAGGGAGSGSAGSGGTAGSAGGGAGSGGTAGSAGSVGTAGAGGGAGSGGAGGGAGSAGAGGSVGVLDCKVGHYVGQMSGSYITAALGDGSGSLSVVSTAAEDGTPGFEFWLVDAAASCDPGTEFCAQLTVDSGRAQGLLVFPGNVFSGPFEAAITGALDCRTGAFRGALTMGQYTIVNVDQMFTGVMTATFHANTDSLIDGAWQTTDVGTCAPGSACGGTGTWSAAWSAN